MALPAAPAAVAAPPVKTPAAIKAVVTPALTAGAMKETASPWLRFGEPPKICDTRELQNQTTHAYRIAPAAMTQACSTLDDVWKIPPLLALVIQDCTRGFAAPMSI